TQAERSALTRETVIQAVVDCIVEEGINAATAARIAERSGVTWGAIVHQFGDKDSLLLAVVERSF
ncbi:MAG: TetR family transcriptional regulator, partial [Gammaproteobacteria bacterium]|nr:TetR family transcriptional regulator [Gammaproteobacteria bacterium]